MVGRLRWPSWFLPDHARPLPTLFTLTQRPSNDLTRLPNALSTTALHSRPLPIVLNSSKQPGTVGDTSTKFTDLPGPSKTHPRSFQTFLRLHKTSPDHQGRERSAVRSAKCDRGLNQDYWKIGSGMLKMCYKVIMRIFDELPCYLSQLMCIPQICMVYILCIYRLNDAFLMSSTRKRV